MFTNSAGLQPVLIGAAFIVFFVARQFATRPVISRWNVLVPIALAFIGLQGLTDPAQTSWLFLGVNLSLGVVLGFARGMTFRVWPEMNGRALMRGTLLTLLLWVATFAIRFAASVVEAKLGFIVGAGTADILLPAAATIGVQTLVVYLRSQDLRLATI